MGRDARNSLVRRQNDCSGFAAVSEVCTQRIADKF